ncbi:hypothetical protein PI95_033580 [Hassallia byssoidea VB512170]|uniref:Uncharacterized protein n=1 Tax=Hassallia byssoidea VB512170 TaxID=1304833 RepID=A0A846HK45_9CYAN|nr:hypothetical protein [Hassalia byssoidea]NEU77283.1 hypothetical protein [Hassalia byssoidea VB512170]
MSNLVWQNLVTTALIGTGRQALQLDLPDNQLGEVLSCLDTSDPERALLGAAGAIYLHEKAGKLPAFLRSPPTIRPPDRREILTHKVLASTSIPLHQTLSQLRHFHFYWSAELTHAVLNELLNYLKSSNPDYSSLAKVMPNFARFMEPSVVVEAFSGLPPLLKGSSQWVKAVNQFISILEFRYEMIQALRTNENRRRASGEAARSWGFPP